MAAPPLSTAPSGSPTHACRSSIWPAGWQPIANEDESLQVVFNGEIFNFVELRAELERRGHRFRTHSDTEVIVHLYEERGDDFVDELNGQFAIALWDRRRRRLVLARDRTGIRPLFCARRGRPAFASEVKALFAARRDARGSMRPAWRAPSATGRRWRRLDLRGRSSLPPGHRMVVDDAGTRTERYWDWTFPEQPSAVPSEDECAEELRALLIDAVRLQLRADVPVGAYLSGGLDSSIITTIIRKHTDTPLRTSR